MKYIQYLNYLLRHKWFVFLECIKRGLWWRAISHDMSKFLPSEFFPYATFFYSKRVRDSTGYYKPTDTCDPAFDHAWFLHQKRNNHHWQYWVIPADDGGEKVLEMGDDDVIEMVCDWFGAGRAQGNPNTLAWYRQNKDKMRLHENTRLSAEQLLVNWR